MQEKACEE